MAFHRSYTDRGQLASLAFNSTTIDTRTYDDGGRMTGSSYNNGVSETRTYNNDNTLASISFSGAAIGNLTYGWDDNKNKTSEAISGTMSGYGFAVGTSGYDDEDRLVNWERADSALDQSWDLSLVGDWDSITENSATQNRTHGPTHELLTVASQSVTHDLKGNITSIPAVLRPGTDPLAMVWDFDNRLVSADVDNDSTADVFYKWDALGRRVYRDDGTTAQVFVQSGQQTIADYTATTAASNPTYTYVYASYIDEPVMRGGSGGLRYYHRNQQYSITALTDGGGTITERYAYSAYGTPTITDAAGTIRTSSADHNRYTYTGREYDEALGLYHYRARMYDSVAGRFCSRDPIGYVDGTSFYKAAMFLTLTDPSGNCIEKRTAEECCADAWADPGIANVNGRPSAGMVICCDGRNVACAKQSGSIIDKDGIDIEVKCTLEHEKVHMNEQPQRPCEQSIPNLSREDIPEGEDLNERECEAYQRQVQCLMDTVGECNGNARCIRFLAQKTLNIEIKMNGRNCNTNYGIETPNWRGNF